MDTFTTPVVNSRAADKHIETIKSAHADILSGIANQQIKVAQYNQAKSEQDKIQAQEDAQANAEALKFNTEARKQSMDRMQKDKELEVKKMALSTP